MEQKAETDDVDRVQIRRHLNAGFRFELGHTKLGSDCGRFGELHFRGFFPPQFIFGGSNKKAAHLTSDVEKCQKNWKRRIFFIPEKVNNGLHTDLS